MVDEDNGKFETEPQDDIIDNGADQPGMEGTDTAVEEETAPEAVEVEQLKKELEDSRNKASEYLDGWQRSRAEFSNYKRRIERDQSQVYQNAAGSVIKRYLEIIDDLDRALKNRPQGGEGAKWAEGIELIYRKFLAALEAEGVKPMAVEGQLFDPNLHEAIVQEDNPDYQSGQIIEEIKQGYILGDRVLRPAMVKIAK